MEKNNIIIGLAAVLVLSLVIVAATGALAGETPSSPTAKEELPDTSAGFQEVTLTFKNYRYELSPSTLVANVPVRMSVDLKTVTGCMRDIVIKQFGVRKYIREGDNIIEFTPDKTGTIGIACSMNMGRGSFTVVEGGNAATAAAPALAAPELTDLAPPSGGCGCGGAGAGSCH